MATGDYKNLVIKLKTQLRRLRFVTPINEQDLIRGNPHAYLPIMHYLLLEASKNVAKFVKDSGFDLFAKTDYRFVEGTYKLLRQHFDYKPVLKLEQFFSEGYGERKVQFLIDFSTAVMAKHAALSTRKHVGAESKKAEKLEEVSPIESKTFHPKEEISPPRTIFPIKELSSGKDAPKPQQKPELAMIASMLLELKNDIEALNLKVDKVQESLTNKLSNTQAEVASLSGRLNYFEKSLTQGAFGH